jgi:ketosteroid isomerase-like protein
MSDDLDLVRQGLAAMAAGDLDGVAAMFADDAELQRVDQFGTLRGRDAVREWLTPDVMELVSIDVGDVRPAGRHVLATTSLRMRGAGAGVELSSAFYLLLTMRDGLATRMAVFTTEADALEAADG